MYFITQLHFDKERFDKDVLVKKDKQRFKAEPHDQKSMMKTSKLFKLCHSDKSPSELLQNKESTPAKTRHHSCNILIQGFVS